MPTVNKAYMTANKYRVDGLVGVILRLLEMTAPSRFLHRRDTEKKPTNVSTGKG